MHVGACNVGVIDDVVVDLNADVEACEFGIDTAASDNDV